MKKLLQLILSTGLLMIFSCSTDDGTVEDLADMLENDWMLTDVTAYDAESCTAEQLFSVRSSNGMINMTNGQECVNLDHFFSDVDGYVSNCPTVDDGFGTQIPDPDFMLTVELYLQLKSNDGDATGGSYMRTMYATYPSGLIYENPFSSFGRWYTHGNKMIMHGLATVEADEVGVTDSRIVVNTEDEIENDKSEW